MTIHELAQYAGEQPALIGGLLALPPVIALLALFGGRDPAGLGPRRYLFAGLVYMVAIPGMLATVLTAYVLFFLGGDLLQLDILVYFAPILTMVLTLALIARTTPLSNVPGFGRIGGLMLMLGAAFAMALILQKTRIWVVFVGGIGTLLVIGLVLFVVMRVGASRLFGDKERERGDRRR